jgi:hypothetical protein
MTNYYSTIQMPSLNQQIYCLKSNLWQNYHGMEDLDPESNMVEWVINVTRKKVLLDLIFVFDLCKKGKTEIVKYYLHRVSKRMAMNMKQMAKCGTVSSDNYKQHEIYYKNMMTTLCNVIIQVRLK